MTAHGSDGEALLTPAEVAALFRVDPKTVTRWAKAGKLTSIRTLGGHRRYRASEVHALLDRFNPAVPAQLRPGGAGTVPQQQSAVPLIHQQGAAHPAAPQARIEAGR